MKYIKIYIDKDRKPTIIIEEDDPQLIKHRIANAVLMLNVEDMSKIRVIIEG